MRPPAPRALTAPLAHARTPGRPRRTAKAARRRPRVRRALRPLTLALLAACAPGSAQTPEAPPDAVEDSLHYAGQDDRVWRYRLDRTDDGEGAWVTVHDPDGGRVRLPAFFAATLGERAASFYRGRPGRLVVFTTRTSFFSLAAVFAVGLVTVVALPFVWHRRRYARERERRRGAEETRRQLAAGLEAERLRLARDLHDGPVQDLHTVAMRLNLLAARHDALGPEVTGAVDEVQSVIRDLRSVSEDLRPPALGPFGLSAAVRAFAERVGRSYPAVRIDLDLDADGQAIDEDVRLALFRVVQEATNNALQHADPRHVLVTLRLGPDGVTVCVWDDGQGIALPVDLQTLARSRHFGILGMNERAEAIGARLEITPDPTGTWSTGVRITAPTVAPPL